MPIIDFNFGRPGDGLLRYPKIRIGREDDKEELSAFLDGVERFVDRGGRVEASVVRDRLGLPDPPEGAVLLQPAGSPENARAAPAAPSTHETPAPRFSRAPFWPIGHVSPAPAVATAATGPAPGAAPPPADDIDLIVAAMADEGWEPAMRPLIDPLLAAMQRAGSYEAALEALVPLLAQMDEAALMQALERAGFAVRAFGLTGADGQLDGE